jgi:anti-sigma factor RsiW
VGKQVVAESAEELELLIDEYLDGRMDPSVRNRFEDRMSKDPELRGRVMSATHSVKLVQQALGWVTPGEDFDDKVSSKIIEITNSGRNLRPPVAAGEQALTSKDPDARLLGDPEAAREKRRLIMLAIAAVAAFALAALAIVYSVTSQDDRPPRELRPPISK